MPRLERAHHGLPLAHARDCVSGEALTTEVARDSKLGAPLALVAGAEAAARERERNGEEGRLGGHPASC